MPARQRAGKKNTHAPERSKAKEATITHSRPSWPPIKPTQAGDLNLEKVIADQVYTIPRVWSAAQCKTYVNFLSTLPLTTTPGKPKKGEATRVSDRYQVDDAGFAESLWSSTGLKQLIDNPTVDGEQLSKDARNSLWDGEVLGLNSNIRIYRYSKGQYFDQHYDESNKITFPSTESSHIVPAKTTWTLLLYLTDQTTGCSGGETVFYPEPAGKREATPDPVIVGPKIGMALLHKHGDDCLLHEGREVLGGEKWIIRSDLCVKR